MIKLTKNQFDEILRLQEPEVFTETQMNSWVEGLKDTLVKAEVDELDEKEKALVDEFNAEFKSFVKVQVICSPEEKDLNKSLKYVNLFIRDKQVSFSEEDQIEKSEDGGEDKVVGKIITGTYLDTELNRELNRVGNTFTKSEETDIEKGGKVANVGEIHNWNGKKFRKEPNGKWVEVSTHKMSKKEHADMANMIETHPDQSDKDTQHYKSQLALHKKNAENLSDKEHSDEEVGKGNK